MSPQLAAMFAKNKPVIIGTAAAAVAGLALLQRKKGGAVSNSQPAGTIPAAAVVPGGGSYDSSAYDVYSAMQSQLGPILQQQMQQTGGGLGGGVGGTPDPSKSGLFSDGLYRVAGDTTVYRIGDGGLTRDWLDFNEATALGLSATNNNNLTGVISKDDPRWSKTKLIGSDNTPTGHMRIPITPPAS